MFCSPAAGDDPVHLHVQEHSHGGLHQSAKVLTLVGGSDLAELQKHGKKKSEIVK